MADFYLDISAVGTADEYEAWAAVPTTLGAAAANRPRPMEGNGLAQSATAASVAIAELQITTLPTDGLTLSIGGSAAITAKTTVAAKNQFAIGASIATATTSLVALLNTFGTAVNQCDVTAATTVSQAALAIPYLYYARLKPGTTDTIQLFTRVAGSTFNTATNANSKVVQTGGWLNSAAASIAFTEGVDGPFGYFVNAATVFGKTQGGAGIFCAKSFSSVEPVATDIINTRTKRAGVGLTILITGTTGHLYAQNLTGTAHSFLFDNGVVWAGDDGEFLVDFSSTDAGGANNVYFGGGAGAAYLTAKRYGNFRARFARTAFNGIYWASIFQGTNGSVTQNCIFEAANTNAQLAILSGNTSLAGSLKMIGGRVIMRRNQPISNIQDSSTWDLTCLDTIFEWLGVGTNVSALFGTTTSFTGASTRESSISHYGCTYSVDGGAYGIGQLMNTPLLFNARATLKFDACVGIDNLSAGFAAVGAVVGGPRFFMSNPKTFSYRYEQHSFTSDWLYGNTYPTRNATTPNGNPMVHRVSWEAGRLDNSRTHEIGRFSLFYRGVEAVKEVSLEMLVPTAEIPNTSQIFALISYTSVADGYRIESTFGLQTAALIKATGVALPDGAGLGSWTINGTTGVTSKKVALTTAYPIKQNTEITITLFIGGAPTGTRTLFIDPEPGVA